VHRLGLHRLEFSSGSSEGLEAHYRDLRLFKIPIFLLRGAALPPLSTKKLGLYFLASP